LKKIEESNYIMNSNENNNIIHINENDTSLHNAFKDVWKTQQSSTGMEDIP
jgi:hypothetical protein